MFKSLSPVCLASAKWPSFVKVVSIASLLILGSVTASSAIFIKVIV